MAAGEEPSKEKLATASRRTFVFLRHLRDKNHAGMAAILDEVNDDDSRARVLLITEFAAFASTAIDVAYGQEQADQLIDGLAMTNAADEA